MSFIPWKKALYVTVTCMAAAVILASCGSSKEKNAEAMEQLPLLSSSEELDSLSAAVGNQMLVLDFYADWCGPCRVLAPTIDRLAVEYKEKARFFRVNVDKSPSLSRAFGVRGIPYIVFMKNGQVVYVLTGVHPGETYKKVLDFCSNDASADECVRKLNEKM
jgi:thioredoxin 1